MGLRFSFWLKQFRFNWGLCLSLGLGLGLGLGPRGLLRHLGFKVFWVYRFV